MSCKIGGGGGSLFGIIHAGMKWEGHETERGEISAFMNGKTLVKILYSAPQEMKEKGRQTQGGKRSEFI